MRKKQMTFDEWKLFANMFRDMESQLQTLIRFTSGKTSVRNVDKLISLGNRMNEVKSKFEGVSASEINDPDVAIRWFYGERN